MIDNKNKFRVDLADNTCLSRDLLNNLIKFLVVRLVQWSVSPSLHPYNQLQILLWNWYPEEEGSNGPLLYKTEKKSFLHCCFLYVPYIYKMVFDLCIPCITKSIHGFHKFLVCEFNFSLQISTTTFDKNFIFITWTCLNILIAWFTVSLYVSIFDVFEFLLYSFCYCFYFKFHCFLCFQNFHSIAFTIFSVPLKQRQFEISINSNFFWSLLVPIEIIA